MMQGPGEMRILMAFWAQALKNRPQQENSEARDSELFEIDSRSGVLQSLHSSGMPRS